MSRRPLRLVIEGAVILGITGLGLWCSTALAPAPGLDPWMAKDSPRRPAHDRLVESFGAVQEVLAVLDEDAPASPDALARGRTLAARLRALPGVASALSLGDLLDAFQLDDGDLDAEMLTHPLVRGTLAGDHALGVVVELDPTAQPATIDAILELTRGSAAVAGPLVLNHTLAEAARRAPVITMGAMVVITGLVVAVALARLGVRPWTRGMALAFLPGLIGTACVSMALWSMSAPLDLVTGAASSLAWVLSLSSGLHLALARDDDRARGHTRRAVTWCTITTAIGLGCLAVGGIESVTACGIAGAVGVIAGGGAAVLLDRLHPPSLLGARPQAQAPARRLPGAWSAVALAAVAVAALPGLARLEARANPISFLPHDHRTVRDAEHIQARLTGLLPIEILVESDDHDARLGAAGAIAATLVEQRLVSIAWSPETIAALPPCDLVARLTRQLDDRDRHRSVVRVRATSMEAHELGRIDAAVRRVALPEGTTASVTGPVPLIIDLQGQLLRAQAESALAVASALCLILAFLARTVQRTLVAIFVNVVPALVVLGAMGWFGLDIDPATAMVAGIASGVAVDDTIHLLTALRTVEAEGLVGLDAARAARARVCDGMTLTTVVLVSGFSAFVFAPFRPIRDFGVLVGVALVVGWIGDALVAPQLLGWTRASR